MEITIPAMAPPPIPDFLLSSLVPEAGEVLCPPDLCVLLFFVIGGVPGGGGGAGPELHELPSFLSLNLTSLKFTKNWGRKNYYKLK